MKRKNPLPANAFWEEYTSDSENKLLHATNQDKLVTPKPF